MKTLVALPRKHAKIESVDGVLAGQLPCSGTVGSLVRVAHLLAAAGMDVTLSAEKCVSSHAFPCIRHTDVKPSRFEHILAHQSHWDGSQLTFGDCSLPKTRLLFQNQGHWAFADAFLSSGGRQIVTCSRYLAGRYRPIRNWREKVTYIYNTYCPVFEPVLSQPQKRASVKRVLFIGAITPTKGFSELMRTWSHLAQNKADLQLVVAGSIGVHHDIPVGPLGIAEVDYETREIIPWLKSLPDTYQPVFLGAVAPRQMCKEIAQSWAVVVNPSWRSWETFCVAAVEAQACNRPVFSINMGGLQETVFRGPLQTLCRSKEPNALGELILQKLASSGGIEKNEEMEKAGEMAGEFVRQKFSTARISTEWQALLNDECGKRLTGEGRTWLSNRVCDAIRLTGTSTFVEKNMLGRH